MNFFVLFKVLVVSTAFVIPSLGQMMLGRKGSNIYDDFMMRLEVVSTPDDMNQGSIGGYGGYGYYGHHGHYGGYGAVDIAE